MIGITHYVVLSLVLFLIGLLGFLIRRNLIIMLVCVEIMLNAVMVLFAAWSKFTQDITGYVLVFFLIAMAAAEAAIGLTLVVLIYKRLKILHSDEITYYKG